MCLRFGFVYTWMCQVKSFAVSVWVHSGRMGTEKAIKIEGRFGIFAVVEGKGGKSFLSHCVCLIAYQ